MSAAPMSAADGVHTGIFGDLRGFVEAVRVGFAQYGFPHGLENRRAHFRLRQSGAENGAEVCSVVVAEAGLKVAL